MDYKPAYLALYHSGELERRIKIFHEKMEHCDLCPHKCKVNRFRSADGFCRSGALPEAASAAAHFGEEPVLSGTKGSGTIFFSHCNLKCIYCQNYDISQLDYGSRISYEQLSDHMISLQEQGCHNINFVTPTHMVYAIVKALSLAIKRGLKIPLVYNCGGYESVETLKLLEGIIDIYMPDLKYACNETGKTLSHVTSYFDCTSRAIGEMHRQTGDLAVDSRGIAYKGVLIRHLVLPGHVEETKKIIDFVYSLSPHTYLNIMSQYRPLFHAYEEPAINHRPALSELDQAVNYAKKMGLIRGLE